MTNKAVFRVFWGTVYGTVFRMVEFFKIGLAAGPCRKAYKMSITVKFSPSTVNFTLLQPKSSAYTRAGSCW